jgi:serine/threonine protein kinase/Tfp pilus assembly protein PilF
MKIDRSIWPALSTLLDDYLDQPEASRQAWLDGLGPEYAGILGFFRELLSKGLALGEGFLEDFPRLATEETGYAPLESGSVVGPYRLIRELGRGGMSIVWLAERADGLLKRRVALKLPLVLLHNSVLAERFARERDILAQITHPNIARLYDAGIAASGQSYLALEYVEGERITEFCGGHQLSLKQRLSLFLDVLHAVEYAHVRSIVHRDLKPSNILVTKEGQVRLLDFGIAKLLVEGEAQETELTKAGGRALTPEYASPEQLAGSPITRASDVYSLGVILFELLTGARLEGHTQALKGDVATIVLHAAHEAPVERYPTAGEFAQDIQRYLKGEPILARPESWWYRMRKFVGRNNVMVASASGAVLALGLSLGITLSQAERATRAEEVAAATARNPQTRATLLVLPFKNLSGDPDQDFASDGLTEDAIAQLRRLDPKHLGVIARTTAMYYRDTPAPLDRIARELGVEYVVQGSLRREKDQVQVTAKLIRASDHSQIWAQTFEDQAAEGIARNVRAALHIVLRSPSTSAPVVNPRAHAEYLRGRYYWNKRDGEDYRRAIEHFQRALDIEPVYAEAYAGLADCYLLLGDVDDPYLRHEKLAKARAAAQKALEIDAALGVAHASLALTLMKQWNWADSEREYRRAIETDPNYATAHGWYAEYLSAEGRFEEALREIGDAEKLDPLSPIIASDHGKFLYYGRRQEEAITQLNKVIQDYPAFSEAYYYLARAYAAAGRYEEALATIDGFSDKTRINWAIELRGYVLARMGRRAAALQVVGEMEVRGKKVFESYIGLGQNNRALVSLETFVSEHHSGWTSLKVDPMLDPLRRSPLRPSAGEGRAGRRRGRAHPCQISARRLTPEMDEPGFQSAFVCVHCGQEIGSPPCPVSTADSVIPYTRPRHDAECLWRSVQLQNLIVVV